MDERPIFYDASGRRRRRFALGVIAFVLLLIVAISIFAVSVLEVPPSRPLPFQVERPPLSASQTSPAINVHNANARLKRLLRREGLLPPLPAPRSPGAGLAVSFYVPWDDSSAASLARHIDDLDWLIPGWVSVAGPEHRITVFPDNRGRAIIAGAKHRPVLLPMIQNVAGGDWDGKGMAALLHDPAMRKALLDRLEPFLSANHADGAMFDFEDLPPSAQPDYKAFLTEAKKRFAPHRWIVTIAVPVDDEAWDLKAYAAIVDRLFLMAYDEHFQGGEVGPIASQPWFEAVLRRDLNGMPPGKIVVAIGSYAYDWKKGGETEAVSIEQSWLTAHESGVMPKFDPPSGNVSFSYTEGPDHHDVWLLDAAGVSNQMAAVRRMGLNSIALWRLGTEDPSVWQIFGASHDDPVPPRVIAEVPAGTNVDIEGVGEILNVASVPVQGHRNLTINPKGMVTDEQFTQLPLPYAIQRAGYRPKQLALTFDDGPDPKWTPRILDILKEYKVPATFFIVGENALTERGLLQRELREGHEIGSHTYTHPNLGEATPEQTRLELNATQRLFQAFTGHSLRFFRAPFFGDAEPTTADEIVPIYAAQQMGYTSVGLHVDAEDWQRPGVQAIIDNVMNGVDAADEDSSANVILLHDSGGDRTQTIAALPVIIQQLRAKGYTFVPVSQLINLKPTMANPPVAASDRLAAQADLALFSMIGFTVVALGWIFTVAITLGILRAVSLSALALWQAWRESRVVFPPIDPSRFVSVLIPAFNEAGVIETSVRRVLASERVNIEVIVIDDGSKDGTGDVVERAYGSEPRVRLLRLENGGKARALNHGLALARGEIVIALDADTQFEPNTIARLARWFADPKLGAVAGNAKVGNRVNLVTRWQALEYITAQNLERRALAKLKAITVVPGAVGAWRAETLRSIGGYPADTLAEDQDLTISIQRAGWGVHYDQYAVAWTEAPESFRSLAKQRFRWAFGTLQCLWKHRMAIIKGRPPGLTRIGLPQAMVFQIGFAAISPVIDLALLVSLITTALVVQAHGWVQSETDLKRMLTYWIVFSLIDLLSGVVAFALERRERWSLLWLLIPQRIGYRQVMYYVVLKALAQALRGPRVGWGKLERSGRVGQT
jgi:peptidoglycan-N-acetylglucosamine deacetylase